MLVRGEGAAHVRHVPQQLEKLFALTVRRITLSVSPP